MENSEFRHLAPLPSQYLRLPANNPGSSMMPGVPGSSMEQLVATNMARLREQIDRDTRKQWNPVWESMIDKAPSQLRGTLKKIMASGVGSEASMKFMQDPAIQAALGTGGIADSIATQRMLSHSGSFGGLMGPIGAGGRISQFAPPTNPGDVIAQNAMRLQGTAQYQSALYSRLYRDDNGKVLPGGNMRFTGGMSTADTINLGSYASQFGGPMSQMLRGTRPEVEAFNRMKVEKHGMMARTMGEFMKTMGSSDLNEGLSQFRSLEGREFGTVNPETYSRKMRSMGVIAARSNMAASDVMRMNSYAEGMIGAGTGMGAGSGYDYGRRMDQGMAMHVTERAAGVIRAKGITNPEEQDKIGAILARRQANIMNTTGGRAIDLIGKLHFAGRLSDEDASDYMKRSAKGENMSPMLREITAKTGVDIRKTMMNDSAFQETRWALGEEGRASRSKAGMSQTQIDSQFGASERNIAQNQGFKYIADTDKINARASARGKGTMVRALEREYGISFTDKQKTQMGDKAMGDLVAQLEADKNMDKGKKQEFIDRIKDARASGRSLSSIQNELNRLGPEGQKWAANAESNYQRQKFDEVTRTDEYKKNVGASTRLAGDDLLTGWGMERSKGETQAARDADMNAKLQKVIADPKTTEERKRLAQGQLDKMKGKPRTLEEEAQQRDAFYKSLDSSYKTENTMETGAETKAGSMPPETAKGSKEVTDKAEKDKDTPVTGGKKKLEITGTLKIEGGEGILIDSAVTESEG